MLVAGAWIGFIWYAKNVSKKYKKNFGNYKQDRALNDDNHLFENSDSTSMLNDITDPSYSYLSYNIYHKDN